MFTPNLTNVRDFMGEKRVQILMTSPLRILLFYISPRIRNAIVCTSAQVTFPAALWTGDFCLTHAGHTHVCNRVPAYTSYQVSLSITFCTNDEAPPPTARAALQTIFNVLTSIQTGKILGWWWWNNKCGKVCDVCSSESQALVPVDEGQRIIQRPEFRTLLARSAIEID